MLMQDGSKQPTDILWSDSMFYLCNTLLNINLDLFCYSAYNDACLLRHVWWIRKYHMMFNMTKANDIERGKYVRKSSVLLQENVKLCVMDMSKLSVEEEWTLMIQTWI